MTEQTTGTTFTLTVTGTEHGEWQGVLRTGTEERPFCSVLELLRAIESQMERKNA